MDEFRRQALKMVVAMSALATVPAIGAQTGTSSSMYAYVGCRTTKERNARGKGISVYRIDRGTRQWEPVQLVEGLDNPSFLAFDRSGKFLYSVHGDLGDVTAYVVNPQDGKLSLLGRQSAGGKNPVHLVPDPMNRFMIIANYATGSVVTMPIQGDGNLGPVVDLAQLPGNPGPHKTQQGSSHPHDVPYDRAQRFIVVPDKGLDKVFVFRVDGSSGKLTAASPPVATREGSGPRHVDFHPTLPFAYVMNELDSTITTYRYDGATGTLKPLQIVPTIPASYTGDNTGAEITVDRSGRYVFGSNRGHDSLVTLVVDQETGLLTPSSWVSSQGKGPRFFAVDPGGDWIYAANENSDTIVGYTIDRTTGKLIQSGPVITTGSPVCIVFKDSAA